MPGEVQKLEHTHWGSTPLAPLPQLLTSRAPCSSPHAPPTDPHPAPKLLQERSRADFKPVLQDMNSADKLPSPGK